MKRVFIMTIALMFLFCIPLLSFAAGKPQPPSSGAFIPPAWSQKLPAAERFVLVLDDNGVLDKETGLVWEKSPSTGIYIWVNAISHCISDLNVGVRKGWHLPTVEQLASLVDTSGDSLKLPTGHPFTNVQSRGYWSATTYPSSTTVAWGVHFGDGYVDAYAEANYYYAWCVRGGQSHDAY